MEEENLDNSKINLEKNNDEFFYGSNYINNLSNIFLNNKPKIKLISLKENTIDITKELEIDLHTICKIYPETITPLFNEYHTKNNIFQDKLGQIDFNTIITRHYNPDIKTFTLFYYKFFQILSKVVYPSIQILYGILNSPLQDTNNFEIILEYIPSNFDEVQTFISKCSNGNEINYLIITKISEVLSYIYECGFPFLMLCPNNIKFNNKLFKQYFKVNEDSDYLYAVNKDYFSNPSKIFNNNFMKIINLGTYLKYKYLNKKYYSINDESLEDICYFSPELLKFIFDENIKTFPDDLNLVEKWDIYSFIFFIKNIHISLLLMIQI